MTGKVAKDFRRNQKHKQNQNDRLLSLETHAVHLEQWIADLELSLQQQEIRLDCLFQASPDIQVRSDHKDNNLPPAKILPVLPRETQSSLEVLARIVIAATLLVLVSYFCVKLVYYFYHSF